MPRGDRTGPTGQGPMTGRAAGFCAGYDAPGYANPVAGRGAGMRRGGAWGRGRGWRHWFHATGQPRWARGWPVDEPTAEQEVEQLKAQAGWLQEQLGAVNQRLNEIEKGG